MLAYMFRFDAKAGYFIYPETKDFDGQKLYMNSGSTFEGNVMPRNDISVTKSGLKIPAGTRDYAEFKEKMQANERAFVSSFLNEQ